MLKNFVMLALGLAFAMSVTACNTVEGLGKDIKKGGDAIEKAATK